MQQTQQYKLNKPEMDDPFSVVPLNENTDKVEGTLSALERALDASARREVFHKLLRATPPEGVKEFDLDLSGIDLTQYGALVMFYSIYNASNTTSVTINSNGSLTLIPSSSQYTSSNHGGGFAVFVPAVDRIFATSVSCGQSAGTTGGARYAQIMLPWSEVSTMKFKPISHQSTIVLYGVRF